MVDLPAVFNYVSEVTLPPFVFFCAIFSSENCQNFFVSINWCFAIKGNCTCIYIIALKHALFSLFMVVCKWDDCCGQQQQCTIKHLHVWSPTCTGRVIQLYGVYVTVQCKLSSLQVLRQRMLTQPMNIARLLHIHPSTVRKIRLGLMNEQVSGCVVTLSRRYYNVSRCITINITIQTTL